MERNLKQKAQRRKKMFKRQNGITLIALVITIIVMLILAGVSLSMTLGDNGILTQAQKATNNWTDAQRIEQLQMAYFNFYVANNYQYVTNEELVSKLSELENTNINIEEIDVWYNPDTHDYWPFIDRLDGQPYDAVSNLKKLCKIKGVQYNNIVKTKLKQIFYEKENKTYYLNEFDNKVSLGRPYLFNVAPLNTTISSTRKEGDLSVADGLLK